MILWDLEGMLEFYKEFGDCLFFGWDKKNNPKEKRCN